MEPYRAELQAAVDAAATAPSIDDRTAAALAGSFYKDFETGKVQTTFGPGWHELLRASPQGGYDGLALYHPSSRSLVIVNRGTEGFTTIPDVLQDIVAGLLHKPGPQLASALDLLRDGYEKATPGAVDQILICGHSLGGALADAQGALGASLLKKHGHAAPPIRVLGIASAGFAEAARVFAAAEGLQPAPNTREFIAHYIRGEDFVPHHPGRSTFGQNHVIASVWEASRRQGMGAHSDEVEWRSVAVKPRQHHHSLYFQFFNEREGRHVWYSHSTDSYVCRDGGLPAWKTRPDQPEDW